MTGALSEWNFGMRQRVVARSYEFWLVGQVSDEK
jgi:hypothetical protein